MSTGFHATRCEVIEENGMVIASLSAASAEEEDVYLMLQHQATYNEQDVKLGMDKPYIEYCGQGWSWYGHILSFRLLRDRVCVRMDREAATHMGNDGLIEVTFELGEGEFANLRSAVHVIFTGQPCFTDET